MRLGGDGACECEAGEMSEASEAGARQNKPGERV